ncbi:MAG: hypothetical protein IKX67_07360 [Bacteroidales bacterium]|nr:hypothetical protein [Bacteroidales bacterium]
MTDTTQKQITMPTNAPAKNGQIATEKNAEWPEAVIFFNARGGFSGQLAAPL